MEEQKLFSNTILDTINSVFMGLEDNHVIYEKCFSIVSTLQRSSFKEMNNVGILEPKSMVTNAIIHEFKMGLDKYLINRLSNIKNRLYIATYTDQKLEDLKVNNKRYVVNLKEEEKIYVCSFSDILNKTKKILQIEDPCHLLVPASHSFLISRKELDNLGYKKLKDNFWNKQLFMNDRGDKIIFLDSVDKENGIYFFIDKSALTQYRNSNNIYKEIERSEEILFQFNLDIKISLNKNNIYKIII